MDIILVGGIVLGLTQLVKITVNVSKRYIPLTALILSGVVFGVAAYLNNIVVDWAYVSTAIVTALTSVGLWSSVKNTVE